MTITKNMTLYFIFLMILVLELKKKMQPNINECYWEDFVM